MPRAIILVLDSFGCGGAEDAASSATRAPTRSAISQRPAPPARRSRGPRHGPLRCPTSKRSASGSRASFDRMRRRRASRPPSPRGQWGYGVETSRGKDTPSGHWEIAGTPLDFACGYFPMTSPRFRPP